MGGAVIGGGISGLAFGILASRHNTGAGLRIYERAPGPQSPGNAIWLYPNALSILDKAGVLSSVLAESKEIRSMEYSNSSFSRMLKLPLNRFREEFNYPVVAILRHRLHRILISALDPKQLELGKKFTSMSCEKGGIRISFSDGTTRRHPWVVGADGMNSRVRESLYPRWRSRYSGQCCWTGISHFDAGPEWQGRTMEVMGRGQRMVFVQISQNQVAWSAIINSAYPETQPKEWPVEFLKFRFRNYSGPVLKIFHHADPESIHQIQLREVPQQHPWNQDSVCLIGDAAHGMTPNLGQGAAQGLEDAWYLNQLLSESGPDSAFGQLYRLRKKRLRRLAKLSGLLGRAGGLENPVLAGLRDAALPLIPAGPGLRQASGLYRLPQGGLQHAFR